MRKLQHKQTLRHNLHPGSDGGDNQRQPVETKVPAVERRSFPQVAGLIFNVDQRGTPDRLPRLTENAATARSQRESRRPCRVEETTNKPDRSRSRRRSEETPGTGTPQSPARGDRSCGTAPASSP